MMKSFEFSLISGLPKDLTSILLLLGSSLELVFFKVLVPAQSEKIAVRDDPGRTAVTVFQVSQVAHWVS